jgi:hypothetical protein
MLPQEGRVHTYSDYEWQNGVEEAVKLFFGGQLLEEVVERREVPVLRVLGVLCTIVGNDLEESNDCSEFSVARPLPVAKCGAGGEGLSVPLLAGQAWNARGLRGRCG